MVKWGTTTEPCEGATIHIKEMYQLVFKCVSNLKYNDISPDASKPDPSYLLLVSALIFRRWHVDRTAFLKKGGGGSSGGRGRSSLRVRFYLDLQLVYLNPSAPRRRCHLHKHGFPRGSQRLVCINPCISCLHWCFAAWRHPKLHGVNHLLRFSLAEH